MSWFTFIIIMLLVLINGYFVAAEFAFVGIRRTRVQELVDSGDKRAKLLLSILDELDIYLSSVQLGITLASIALGWLGEPYFSHLFEALLSDFHIREDIMTALSVTTAYLIVTYFHMVVGEISPKSLAIRKYEPIALWSAFPLYLFTKLTKPLLYLFLYSAQLLLRPFKVELATVEMQKTYSEDELRLIIANSSQQGILEEEEQRLLYNVLEFADTTAKEIMTPRFDIVAISIDSSIEKIRELAQTHGHSRFPVFEGKLDNILGAIHIKDILAYLDNPDEFSISKILRKILILPESKHVDAILKEMQQSRTQIAVIVDEFGSVQGLVTMEDVVEAIFGPIADEFDIGETPNIQELKPGQFLVHGLTPLDDFNTRFSTSFSSSDSVTVAGYLMELLDKVPKEGDTIPMKGLEITVAKMDGNRIDELIVTVQDTSPSTTLVSSSAAPSSSTTPSSSAESTAAPVSSLPTSADHSPSASSS